MTTSVTSARSRRRRRLLLAIVIATLVSVGLYFAIRSIRDMNARSDAIALAETAPPDKSLPALLHCLEREPRQPDLLRAIVTVMMRSGAAVPDLEPFTARWCQVSPDDPDAFRNHFTVMHRLTRYSEAIGAAEHVLELAPSDDQTRSDLAGLYLLVGRYDDAAREYSVLASQHPESRTQYQTGLARAEWERGNRAEAVRLLDEVLAIAPQFAPALILRGTAHYHSGEYDKAIDVLRRVPRGPPAEAQLVLYHIALSYDRLGRKDDASTAFRDLATIQNAVRYSDDARQRPDDLTLQLRAAESLLVADYPDRATAILESAIARHGPNRATYDLMSRCYNRMGKPELARDTRAKADRLP